MKENSIEEDITRVKQRIEDVKEYIEYGLPYSEYLDLENSFDNILSDYKRVLKTNEVLLKENEELKFKEKSRIIGKYGDIEIHDLINRALLNDYIPIQEVKDKIEKLKINLVDMQGEELLIYESKIDILQELLEGRK